MGGVGRKNRERKRTQHSFLFNPLDQSNPQAYPSPQVTVKVSLEQTPLKCSCTKYMVGISIKLRNMRNWRCRVMRKVGCIFGWRKGSNDKGKTENSDMRLIGEVRQYLSHYIISMWICFKTMMFSYKRSPDLLSSESGQAMLNNKQNRETYKLTEV